MNPIEKRLLKLGVDNVEQWRAELDRSPDDPDEHEDILAQGRFAVEFADRGMSVVMNPMGISGPDLLLPTLDIYVEVLRLRPRKTDLGERGLDSFVPYGNIAQGSNIIRSAIVGKSRYAKDLPQVAGYLVAIRSDSDTCEDIELEIAVAAMEEEARSGGAGYGQISGVLFDDGWVRTRDQTRWQLWENPNAAPGRHLAKSFRESCLKLGPF